jgi:hypothetical protein
MRKWKREGLRTTAEVDLSSLPERAEKHIENSRSSLEIPATKRFPGSDSKGPSLLWPIRWLKTSSGGELQPGSGDPI